MNSTREWYLIRKKPGRERWVRDQLSVRVPELFLPMLRARTSLWGKLTVSVGPLFPSYLFGRFDLALKYFEVRYLPGVSGIVSAGKDPLMIPEAIVTELKSRAVNDVIEVPDKPFDNGERLLILDGPFRGFETIFDRYVSGADRVAILLGAVEGAGLRIVLPAHMLARCSQHFSYERDLPDGSKNRPF